MEAHEAALQMRSEATCWAAAQEVVMSLVECAVTTSGGAKPLDL